MTTTKPSSQEGPGVLLTIAYTPDESRELVELADTSGYSELWYGDIRFERDVYVALAAAACHSRNLLLGPGVNDPYSRHPALIAMAIATLDELSGGRAQLGLGTGAGGFAEMHIPHERPVRAVREAIELIRAMLTGSIVNYTGEMYHLDGARLTAPTLHPVPIFVASHGAQMLRLCGRIADGILLANMGRRAAIDHALAAVREGETAEGRSPGTVAIHLRLETLISDRDDEAIAVMRKRFATRINNSYPHWEYLEELGIEPSEKMRAAAQARDIQAVEECLTADDVRASTLVGDTASVIKQLGEVLNRDINLVTIRPFGVDKRGVGTTMSKFIENVWPEVRALTGAKTTTSTRKGS